MLALASTASTPLWVPILVAIVGVLGTLSAAIFTQIWAANRENERWVRERAAEEKRWEREDHARWLEERKTVYAQLLLGLDALDEGLRKAETQLRAVGRIEDVMLSQMKILAESAGQIYESLRLIAPNQITELGGLIMQSQFVRKMNLEADRLEDVQDAAERGERSRKLYSALRADLGIED